ncbi:MAG: acyltransferase [Oscillospiraceae bacterium]|nr:acyltransferase [Oscillospiraceae bacterium]
MNKKDKRKNSISAALEKTTELPVVPAGAESVIKTAADTVQDAAETVKHTESKKQEEKAMQPVQNEKNGFLLLSKYRGAIMGIAAIWILIFHEWIQLTVTPEDGSYHVINMLERYIKAIGFCGVDIFLMLSGIGLTFAIKKDSLGKFYYRRLRRILLPFLTVAVIRFILEDWGWQNFIGNVTGWKFYTVSMYSYLWFVPAICTLYLVFPLYYKLFLCAESKIMFTIGAIIVWLMATLYLRDSLRGDLFGFTNRIPVFLIGILFGWMTQNRREIVFTPQTWLHIIFTALLGFYLAFLANFRGYPLIVPVSNCCIPNCLIAISFPFLLAKGFSLLEQKAARFGKAVLQIFAFFGAFSLEFYCVQEWLAGWLMPKLFEHGWQNPGVNLVIFVSVTAAAFISSQLFVMFWKLVEMPFRKKEKKSA